MNASLGERGGNSSGSSLPNSCSDSESGPDSSSKSGTDSWKRKSIDDGTGMPAFSRYSSFLCGILLSQSLDLTAPVGDTHQKRLTCRAPESHKIVTILRPRPFRPHLRASRTQATRLTADDEPRNRPSCRARCRDMATASASVTLSKAEEQTQSRAQERVPQKGDEPDRVVDERQCLGQVLRDPVQADPLDDLARAGISAGLER